MTGRQDFRDGMSSSGRRRAWRLRRITNIEGPLHRRRLGTLDLGEPEVLALVDVAALRKADARIQSLVVDALRDDDPGLEAVLERLARWAAQRAGLSVEEVLPHLTLTGATFKPAYRVELVVRQGGADPAEAGAVQLIAHPDLPDPVRDGKALPDSGESTQAEPQAPTSAGRWDGRPAVSRLGAAPMLGDGRQLGPGSRETHPDLPELEAGELRVGPAALFDDTDPTPLTPGRLDEEPGEVLFEVPADGEAVEHLLEMLVHEPLRQAVRELRAVSAAGEGSEGREWLCVSSIPVTEIQYTFGEAAFALWVYGFGERMWADDEPVSAGLLHGVRDPEPTLEGPWPTDHDGATDPDRAADMPYTDDFDGMLTQELDDEDALDLTEEVVPDEAQPDGADGPQGTSLPIRRRQPDGPSVILGSAVTRLAREAARDRPTAKALPQVSTDARWREDPLTEVTRLPAPDTDVTRLPGTETDLTRIRPAATTGGGFANWLVVGALVGLMLFALVGGVLWWALRAPDLARPRSAASTGTTATAARATPTPTTPGGVADESLDPAEAAATAGDDERPPAPAAQTAIAAPVEAESKAETPAPAPPTAAPEPQPPAEPAPSAADSADDGGDDHSPAYDPEPAPEAARAEGERAGAGSSPAGRDKPSAASAPHDRATHEVTGTSQDVEAPWLALRAGRSPSTDLLAKMPDGTRVTVLRQGRRWWKVRIVEGEHAGRAGWANRRWLRELP